MPTTYTPLIISGINSKDYRSHDKYRILHEFRYMPNVLSLKANLAEALFDIYGLAINNYLFSVGPRNHAFSTTSHGFKSISPCSNQDLTIAGDAFLVASGGEKNE